MQASNAIDDLCCDYVSPHATLSPQQPAAAASPTSATEACGKVVELLRKHSCGSNTSTKNGHYTNCDTINEIAIRNETHQSCQNSARALRAACRVVLSGMLKPEAKRSHNE